MGLFRKIRERLTGISCPIFGLSWNPSQTEHTKANQIITYLEDRRVLYYSRHRECSRECIESVFDIRKFLTEKMLDITPDTKLYNYLNTMRIACSKFLDEHINNGTSSKAFYSALEQLRETYSIMLGEIAVTYDVNIKDELAGILPEKDSEK